MLCSLSTKLGEKEMNEITSLEKELRHPILAFSCHSVDPAKIGPDELIKIQQLEAKLGVSLVAVDS